MKLFNYSREAWHNHVEHSTNIMWEAIATPHFFFCLHCFHSDQDGVREGKNGHEETYSFLLILVNAKLAHIVSLREI
jgi:hypothetical protein